jgi:hypothetical protein
MTTAPDLFLDAGMRGFIVNTAKREYWRVAELVDFEDLIQDGYVCYYKCFRRYTDITSAKNPTKDQRRHFQSLVKTTFFNHISTLAAKHKGVSVKAVSQLPAAEAMSENEVWDTLMPSTPEEGTLRALLASAPAEIKQLAMLLASDGLSLLGFERKRKGRRLLRETTNEFYCRLLGRNPEQEDIVGRVRAYFRPS